MQVMIWLRKHLAPTRPVRLRRWPNRAFALASVTLLMGPCAPRNCTPPATYFGWVGVGGSLPTDEQCASWVRDAPENRPHNDGYNATTWGARAPEFARSTGNFAGTTDEIIQWAACKWGFDEDTLRAQVAKESYWSQLNLGDWGSDPSRCAPEHPIGVDGRPGQCPESVGMMQVRAPYFPYSAAEGALKSSAYNLDVALHVWRNCFDGLETWLNQVERGRDYAAGDAWGCIGRWFSGRWYTQPSVDYIVAVQDYLNRRIWTDQGFIDWRP